ncbi:hypothetical protein HDV05_007150 [Chytridiales sp. JEL 0842]|nr:hypothetical protein HDV05_007150 [Chytridiales sp. JEL 0842]
MFTTTTTTTVVSTHPNWGYILCVPLRRRDAPPKPLPTVSLTAHASIIDTNASVTITQTFTLPASHFSTKTKKPLEAIYRFPLPSNAAVCAFESEFNNNKIKGVVQAKQKAREIYTNAIQSGRQASLLEQEAPDVFQISIGNLKCPKEGTDGVVVVRLTYVQELNADAENDEIRFSLLSKSLKERYGPAPTFTKSDSKMALSTLAKSSAPSSEVGEPSVQISITMPSNIRSVSSPSHAGVSVQTGTHLTPTLQRLHPELATNTFNPHHAALKLDNDDDNGQYLDKEMVVVVKADGLDKPRCLVEKHPTDGTHALSLTLVPKFALNEIRTEIIILIDRSGSMQGSKITQASRALQTLLRSLPASSYFNIIGFGSTYQTLFPKSVEYNASTLSKAEKAMKTLNADLGGTEIKSAMEKAFEMRRLDMPTQIFVLTDGEVWDSESLFGCIKDNVANAEKVRLGRVGNGAFVRVFALGIGNDVSHDLVEGMARHGGGFAQFVTEEEKLSAKVVKMVKAALLPPVTNYKIHWTGGAEGAAEDGFEVVASEKQEKKTISLFDDALKPEEPKDVEPEFSVERDVQQAPYILPNFFPGSRFTAYAILAPHVKIPETLTITGTSTDGPISLTVPILPAPAGTTIHTLAARKLLQDLEDGRSFLHVHPDAVKSKKTGKALGGPVPSSVVEKVGVEVGVKYGLVGKWTSFVAVDEKGEKKEEDVEMEKKAEDSESEDEDAMEEDDDFEKIPAAEGGTVLPSYFQAQQSTYGSADRRRGGGGAPKIAKKLASGPFRLSRSTCSATIPPPPPSAPQCASFAPPPPPPRGLAAPGSLAMSSYSAPAPCAAPPPPYSSSHAPMRRSASISKSKGAGSFGGFLGGIFSSKKPAPSPSASVMSADMDLCMEESTATEICAQKEYSTPSAAAPLSFGVQSFLAKSSSVKDCSKRRKEAVSSDKSISAFILLQAFDGSFDLGDVASFVGLSKKTVLDALRSLSSEEGWRKLSKGDMEKVAGTVLALKVLHELFGSDEEEWELLAEKSVKWGKGLVGDAIWREVVKVIDSLKIEL